MVTYHLVIKTYTVPPTPLLIGALEVMAKRFDKRKKAKLSPSVGDTTAYLGHPRESREPTEK